MTLGKDKCLSSMMVRSTSASLQLNTPNIPLSKLICNGFKKYAEYEVVSVNGMLLKTSKHFVTLGKGQFMVTVQV